MPLRLCDAQSNNDDIVEAVPTPSTPESNEETAPTLEIEDPKTLTNTKIEITHDSSPEIEVIETFSGPEIPLFLSETTVVPSDSKPSGPWKVTFTRCSFSDKNFQVHQTPEEKRKFGSIVQSSINSNPTSMFLESTSKVAQLILSDLT